MTLTPTPTGTDIQVNTTTTDQQKHSSVTALDDGGFVVTWSSLSQDGDGWGIYGQRYDASGATVGSEFQVNTSTASNQEQSSVTALANDGFVVTWSSFNQDGSNYGIYGQRYDASGTTVGGEFLVNTTTFTRQDHSSVTALDDGGFVVTWSSLSQDGDSWGIYGQRYDASGAVVGSEFQVNTTTANVQLYSSATALPNGGFVVIWQSFGQDGNDYGIYGQRYDASGTTVGGEFQVNTTTTIAQEFSSVTALADGGFVVTWSSFAQDGSNWGIYGQRYDASGATVGGELQVNTTTTDQQKHSSVTALDDGGFVVTWSSLNQDGDGWGIYGQRYDASGSAIGSEFRLNDITAGDQFAETFYGSETVATLADGSLVATWSGLGGEEVFVRIIDVPFNPTPIPSGTDIQVNTTTTNIQQNSSVTALDDGGFVVTWQSQGQDGSGFGIYGQRYDASGATVGGEFQVNTTTTDGQQNSSVTALAGGGFVLTWSSNNQDGDSWGIYGQRYDASGTTVGGEFQVNTTTADQQRFSSVTALDDGGFVVTWSSDNQDGNSNGVYGQRYDASGATVGGEFQINTETNGDQTRSSGTALNDGGFVVTWNSAFQDGSGNGIYGQRYDASGATVGSEFQINTETGSDQTLSSGTAINDGGFVITWTSANQDGSGSGIYGQRYDANSVAVGGEFQVNTTTFDTQSYSSVTALPDGGFVVVWSSLSQDGSGSGIYGQRYDASGATVGSEFRLNDITVGHQIAPTFNGNNIVATLANGSLVATWAGTGTEEVFVRIIDVPTENDAPILAGIEASALDYIENGPATPVTVGDVVPVGGEFLVNTFTGTRQDSPSVTELAVGGFVVTWTNFNASTGDTSGLSISGQIFDAAGQSVGGEFLVNTTTMGGQAQSNVTGLANGGFVVTWIDGSQTGGDTSSFAIRGQIFDVTGMAVGSEFLVNTTTTDTQLEPSVTGLVGGGFVVTWTDESATGGDTSVEAVRGQIFDAAGMAVGGEFLVNTTTVSNQREPSVTGLEGGGFVVTWVDISQTGGDTSSAAVRGQIFDGSGQTAGGEFLVNTTTTDTQLEPSVTGLEGGGFVVTWVDFSQTGGDTSSAAVRGQIFDAAGMAVGGEFLVNTTTQGDQREPSVSGLEGGGFVVTWHDDSQTGGDTSSLSVRGQIFDAAGIVVGGEFLVNTTTADDQFDSSVTGLAGGRFIVTWTDESQTGGDTSNSAIRGQIFDLPPSVTVTDPDDANIESATIAIITGFSAGEDVLGFIDQNGITGSYAAGTGILTLAGSATLDQYESALQSITYENTSENPNAALRTLSFTVNDGEDDSNIVTRDITVTPVNDAPVIKSFSLTNVDNVSDDATLELLSTIAATTAKVGGTTYLFVAGNDDDGVSVFAVAADGTLSNVENVTDDATLEIDGIHAITTAEIGGTTFLFAAGFSDEGVSVFAVAADGTLSNVENVTDDATLQLRNPRSVTTADVNGTTYLFAAGANDGGVSVFSVAADGTLTNVDNVTDDAALNLWNASSVTTAKVGGLTYLFVSGANDDGVSVFSVAADGTLTNVENVTDDALIELDGAWSVTTADVGETTYLFVAGVLDDGVSVFSVAADGTLTNVDNVNDDATLKLLQARSVTTANVDGTTYLFAAGTTDAGVSVFQVANDGMLTNVGNITDDATLELSGAQFVATAEIDGTEYLFAGGSNGASVFSISNSLTADFTEGGPATTVAANATLSDAELDGADNWDGATLTVARQGGASAEDIFGFAAGTVTVNGADLEIGGLARATFTQVGGTLNISFNANSRASDADAVLQALTYANTSDAPSATVTLDYTINDGNTGAQGTGGALTDMGSITVNITAVNDAPVARDDIYTGSVDIFISNVNSEPNTVFFNDGSGSFADSGQLIGALNSRGVALRDLDADGDLDAFIANNGGPSSNRVYLNNGLGQFVDSGQALDSNGSHDVALGDLDQDGDLDAFIANNALANAVLLNDGLGNFTNSGQALGARPTNRVVLGDFDADGDLDAFTANNSSNTVFINDGHGVFTDSGQLLGASLSNGVAIGDVDGDGDLDAFIANASFLANRIFINDGLGNFSDSGQILGSNESLGVAFGDIDDDGDIDAVVANNGQANRIYLNDGSGNFTDSGQALGTNNSRDVVLTDVDGDGDLDAVFANFSGSTVYLNNSFGIFSDTGQILGTGNSLGLAVGDLDNDGLLANQTHTLDVLANDTDPEGDNLTITGVETTTGTAGQSDLGANLTITGTGRTVAYDGASAPQIQALSAGETLTDTFKYTISDGNGGTDTATVTITVAGVNDAPDAVADVAAATENGAVVLIDILANDSDVDSDDDSSTLMVVAASAASGAIVTFAGTAGAGIEYDPDSTNVFESLAVGETATDTITYTIEDSHGATATSEVIVTITGTNDGVAVLAAPSAPTIFEAADGSAEEIADQLYELSGTQNFTDADLSDTHTVVRAAPNQAPLGGSFDVIFINDSTGGVVGQYDWDYSINDSQLDSLAEGEEVFEIFGVVTSDGNGGSTNFPRQFRVVGANDAPDAAADIAAATENGAVVLIDVLANDSDVDSDDDSSTLVVVAASAASGAIVTFAGTAGAGIEYDPDSTNVFESLAVGETATDTITHTIEDSHGATATSEVIVTITGTNDAAVIGGQLQSSVTEDTILAATGALTISDVDTGEESFSAGAYAGSFGSLDLTATGEWTYTLANAGAAVQALDTGQLLTDDVEILSFDGTMKTISITINGTDEPNGNNNGQVVDGTPGDDPITTGSGSDVVNAGAGDDVVSTGDQSDLVQAGAGDDTVNGGTGQDTIFGDAGNDTLFGEDGADIIHGGTGDDEIHGGAGRDTLHGDADEDQLFGGDDNDDLFGGDGDDVIDPGDGKDLMTGGSGFDVFVFDFDGERDTVLDFEDEIDLIRLDGITFNDLTIKNKFGGALISFDGDQMLLDGIDAAQITVDDFLTF